MYRPRMRVLALPSRGGHTPANHSLDAEPLKEMLEARITTEVQSDIRNPPAPVVCNIEQSRGGARNILPSHTPRCFAVR